MSDGPVNSKRQASTAAPDAGGASGPAMIGGPVGPGEARFRAITEAARFNGTELDRAAYRGVKGETVPSPATLVAWLQDSGLTAKAARVRFRNLMRFANGTPAVLLFNDGSAGLMVGHDAVRNVVHLRDPMGPPTAAPVEVDELRLTRVWAGDVVLVRRKRGEELEDERFDVAWLAKLVLTEKRILAGIAPASIVLAITAVLPILIVMSIIDKVLVYQSMNTLITVSLIWVILVFYDTILSWARRELIIVLSTRVDTKINLHIFNRMLALPLDYFERHPAGQTLYRLNQVWRVRSFLTGRLMTTCLDFVTLLIIAPFLFYLNAELAWVMMACALLMALIIAVFLPTIRYYAGMAARAEARKGGVITETVTGIRTVKTLALEPGRREIWDQRVAEAAEIQLHQARHANWPQTLINPLQFFIGRGVMLFGAYLIISQGAIISVGGLIAFMMIAYRVASPLISLAGLMEDLEDVRAAIIQAGFVLNNPTEMKAMTTGLRPQFSGAVSFDDVTFTYPGGNKPALEKVTFEIPAGTMLGIVGKSGSGKSTITRLLQGVNRDYSGFLKIDGAELREVNLTHLRRSLGVVLQDNFLFRGSVRDNILADRPGLTLEDAIRAARLAGAEEFIERLPQGYETQIEEGSANLSGGQRQRLAIARALVADPRILVLDEATSALDPESEALVNANLTRIGKGRTMVIVSHRLSSLIDCDMILVLENGKVADIGPHPMLVERCPTYRQLWLQQNRHLQSPNMRGATPALAQGDD